MNSCVYQCAGMFTYIYICGHLHIHSHDCYMVFISTYRPDDCPDKLHLIIQHCQEHNPEDRPSFSAIRHFLRRERVRTRTERLKTIRSNTVEHKKQENEKAGEDACTEIDQDNGQELRTEGAVVQQ